MTTDQEEATDVTKLRQGIDEAMSNVETWLVEESKEMDTRRKKNAANIPKRHSYHGKDRLMRYRRRKNPKSKDDKSVDYRRNTVIGSENAECDEKFVKDVLLNTDYKEIVSELDSFMKTYFEDIYSKVKTLPFPLKEADLEVTLEVCVDLDDPAQGGNGQFKEKCRSLAASRLSLYCNDSNPCSGKDTLEDSHILKDQKNDQCLREKKLSNICISVRQDGESKANLQRKDECRQDPNPKVDSVECNQDNDSNALVVEKIEDSGISDSNEKSDECVTKLQEDDESVVIVDMQYEDLELGKNDSMIANDENICKHGSVDEKDEGTDDKNVDRNVDPSKKCFYIQVVDKEQNVNNCEIKHHVYPKSTEFGQVDIINANLNDHKVDITTACPNKACVATDSHSHKLKREKTDDTDEESYLSTDVEDDSYSCLTSQDFEELKECLNVQSDISHTSSLEVTFEETPCSPEHDTLNMCLSAENSCSLDEKRAQELDRCLDNDSLLSVIYEQSSISGSNSSDLEDDTCLTKKIPNNNLNKYFPQNTIEQLNTRTNITQEGAFQSSFSTSGGEGNLSLGFSTDEQTYDSSTCESFLVTDDSSICSSVNQRDEREDSVLTVNVSMKMDSSMSDSHTTISVHISPRQREKFPNSHMLTEDKSGEDSSTVISIKEYYDSCTSFEIIDDWHIDVKSESAQDPHTCDTVLRISDHNTHLREHISRSKASRHHNIRDSTVFSSFEVLGEPNALTSTQKITLKFAPEQIKQLKRSSLNLSAENIKDNLVTISNSASRNRLDEPYLFSSFEHLDENNNFYFRRKREKAISACSSYVHLEDPDVYLKAKNVEDSGISLSAEKAEEDSGDSIGGQGEKKSHRKECVSSGDEYRIASNPRRRIRLDSRERHKRKLKKKEKTWLMCAPFLCTK